MKPHLPVVGSTAATTEFCAERIDGPGGEHLWVDGNAKITRDNGTYDAPRPNAFSLLAASVEGIVDECPGSTPTCRSSCYVRGLERAQPGLYEMYRHNSEAIRRILADWHLADDWACAFAEWIRRQASGGFRWHVSGDVFTGSYADWIARVSQESPDVPAWIYTRSFDYVPIMVAYSADSLRVNLSADKDNYGAAMQCRGRVLERLGRALTICYLVESAEPVLPSDLPTGSVVFPDYDLRPRGSVEPTDHPWWKSLTIEQRRMVCPVDAFGKSEALRCGPCRRCL